jgi:hypothetical protein
VGARAGALAMTGASAAVGGNMEKKMVQVEREGKVVEEEEDPPVPWWGCTS